MPGSIQTLQAGMDDLLIRHRRIDVLIAAVAWPRYIDGVSNLARKLIDVTDAAALVLLVEMEGRTVCIVRSRVAGSGIRPGHHPQR